MTVIAALPAAKPRLELEAAPSPAATLTKELEQAGEYFRSLGVTEQEGAGRFQFQRSADFAGVDYDSANDFILLGDITSESGKPVVDNETAAQLYAARIASRIGFATELEAQSFPVQVTLLTHVKDVLTSAYDADDWTIGEGTNAKPQRDMRNPRRLGLPASADEAELVTQRVLPRLKTNLQLYKLAEIMASVPDHAAAKFGEKIGRDEMAQLYLQTLRNGDVHDYSGVGPFAAKVTAQAARMFGAGSRQHEAVANAWTSVGLLDTPQGETSFGFSG